MTTSNEWHKLPKQIQETIMQHQKELPVSVGSIAKALGLKVKSSTLKPGISGEIRKDGDSYLIKVNRHDVKTRQRFTVAHEIAHFLLHEDKIGDGIVDDVLYRSSLSDVLEAQANRLAADILMPMNLIIDRLEFHKKNKKEKRIEIVSKEADVSTTALNIRLGQY